MEKGETIGIQISLFPNGIPVPKITAPPGWLSGEPVRLTTWWL